MKVIHEAKALRYIVQSEGILPILNGQQLGWSDHSSFADQYDAINCADKLAANNPSGSYRVVDTEG